MTINTATSSSRRQLIAEVQSLGGRDSIAVLPRLAAIDREACGYLAILVNWILRSGAWASLLLIAGVAATGSLLMTSMVWHVFLELASVVPAYSTPTGTVATLLTATVLIYRSLGKTDPLPLQGLSPHLVVSIILFPLRLLAIWVVAGRQFAIWFPLAVLVVLGGQICVVQAFYYLIVPQQLLATLAPWQVSLPLLLVSGLIIWSIGRRRPLRLIMMLILLLAAIGGMRGVETIIALLQQAVPFQNHPQESSAVVADMRIVAFAGVASLGLVVLLQPIAIRSYNKLIDVKVWMVELFQLRLALHRVLQAQHRRNRALVGNKITRALCTACITRIEPERERISYHRLFTYGRCKLCGTDQYCVPNITEIEGIVNAPQSTDTVRSPAKVRGHHAEVDLNSYLVSEASLPKALTAVLFLKASSRDIETFLLRYEIQERDKQITPRRSFMCTLTSEAIASKGLRVQLDKVFGRNLRVQQPSLQQTGDFIS